MNNRVQKLPIKPLADTLCPESFRNILNTSVSNEWIEGLTPTLYELFRIVSYAFKGQKFAWPLFDKDFMLFWQVTNALDKLLNCLVNDKAVKA